MSDAGNDGEVETQNPTFSNEEENADSSTATADAISTGIGNSLTAADIAARHAALPWSHRVVRTWNTLLGISANSSKFRVTLIGGFVFFTSYVYVLWSVLGQTVYQHTHVQHHPGEPLPQLSFSQDNMTVQRSLVTMMNDLGGIYSARAVADPNHRESPCDSAKPCFISMPIKSRQFSSPRQNFGPCRVSRQRTSSWSPLERRGHSLRVVEA